MDILTKLEELVLLTVLKLKDNAYGISVYNQIVEVTGRDVAVSSVYFPLERLTKKQYLESRKGDPSPMRGGIRKRFYRVTDLGLEVLSANRRLNESIWQDSADLLENIK